MKKRPSGAGENIWLTLDSYRCPCTLAVVWMYFKENFLAVRVPVPSPVPAGCFSEPLAPAGVSGEEQHRPGLGFILFAEKQRQQAGFCLRQELMVCDHREQ